MDLLQGVDANASVQAVGRSKLTRFPMRKRRPLDRLWCFVYASPGQLSGHPGYRLFTQAVLDETAEARENGFKGYRRETAGGARPRPWPPAPPAASRAARMAAVPNAGWSTVSGRAQSWMTVAATGAALWTADLVPDRRAYRQVLRKASTRVIDPRIGSQLPSQRA